MWTFEYVITIITSAIVGGIVWDLIKFPLSVFTNAIFKPNSNDINGYWIGVAHSQKKRDFTAKELMKINLAKSNVKGTLYQMTCEGQLSVYDIIGFCKQGQMALSYRIMKNGIQTGTFNLIISNDEDQHFGIMTGNYTEYYSKSKTNLSSNYTFYRIEVPLYMQIILNFNFFTIQSRGVDIILKNYKGREK